MRPSFKWNGKLMVFAKRIAASVFFFITFIYISILMSYSPTLFSVDVINNRIKLIGPNKEVVGFINEKFLSLLRINLGTTYDSKVLGEIVIPYIIKSIELLLLGILLGFILGILKGIADSRRDGRDRSYRLLWSIIPLSLPDILMIAILQYIAIWLGKHGIPLLRVAGTGSISHMILPVVALALPCACYIARITAVAIEECYQDDYVKIARGKGCSSQRILWNHVMRNAMGTILKGLSNITAMIICNMLIVEYLFSYPGLTMLLVKMHKNMDKSSFISIIVIWGVVYFSLDIVFQLASLAINKNQVEEAA